MLKANPKAIHSLASFNHNELTHLPRQHNVQFQSPTHLYNRLLGLFNKYTVLIANERLNIRSRNLSMLHISAATDQNTYGKEHSSISTQNRIAIRLFS